MPRSRPSFDALSPRFSGFDAYFQAEIAPFAPALAPRAASRPPLPLRLRLLLIAAAAYLALAPFALIFFPAETAQFRPWAIVSFFIILPGVLFGVLAPADAETRLTVAADAWAAARRRIAAFFGFEHAPPLTAAALARFVEICPAPKGADRFEARERILGRIRKGPAAGVIVELVEGVVGRAPVAMCAMRFGGAAYGVGALLDDRIPGVDRAGLAPMATGLPPGFRALAGFAENTETAARLTAPETLAAFAEIREETASTAVNLAIVDDAARLYFALTEPVFTLGDATPNAMSVGHALHDYDALVRMAEALTPLFEVREAEPEAAEPAGTKRPAAESAARRPTRPPLAAAS